MNNIQVYEQLFILLILVTKLICIIHNMEVYILTSTIQPRRLIVSF